MSGTIKVNHLIPGDVLLYEGTSFLSRAIQFFDGTDYSHAALYLGDNLVGEAIASGLKRRPYEEGASGNRVEARRLKEVVPTMTPVLDTANTYLDQGNRYGYEQLLLLAFLCLTRKLRFTPSLRQLIRSILDAAGAVLTQMVSGNRQPMICSEFVYRAYDEAVAGPGDLYSLWINTLTAPVSASFTSFARPMPALGAPPFPIKGQGIHPQSLLAFVNSSSGSTWVGPAAPSPSLGFQAQPKREAEQLEELVEHYLEESRDLGVMPHFAPPSPTGPTLADLRGATESFALSLYAATHKEEETDTPAVPAQATSYLTQVAADFVTPGDLYKSQSLFPLGEVES